MGQGSSTDRSLPTQDSRVIRTRYGNIIGRRFVFENWQVDAFQGIPYAKPPIGDLRFRKPEPPESWEGVRETKAFAASPIQKPTLLERKCTKDVVVVTVEYRVGYLGFFSTGDEYCRGNFGLWDQIFALKWIQENISVFNGDPNNVTVMGQSSGAGNADLLSLCPDSRDLFHRVILMSGNASCDWAINYNIVERCRIFAEKNGVKHSRDSAMMIDILRSVPASKFALSLADVLEMSECPVGPCIDGDLITKNVSELRKEAPAKPMLIGSCSSEGLIFIREKPSVSAIMENVALLVPEVDYPIVFKKFRNEIYDRLLTDPDDSAAVARANVEVLSDLFSDIAIQQAVLDALEKENASVYLYSYDYYNAKSWGPLSLYFRWPFKETRTESTTMRPLCSINYVGKIFPGSRPL
ncbi:hypothetical protein KIN20_012185 [Parelaphostrongylus tenuis]|uniref:Carboxylesterase type B domain-containing protein n=1 Tax=Parelaphostrongylus tenuis TaxID=148309 RepID=A0AAD5QMQ4_PARTN|nr:hypothetical protein KIN20_012185 [Parelaphostrongylus tenuis]